MFLLSKFFKISLFLTFIFLRVATFRIIQQNEDKADVKYAADDEFEYLVSGGYRPEFSPYAKHIVSLRIDSKKRFTGGTHYCGGSVLTSTAIISAAHCFYDNSNGKRLDKDHLRVVVGSTNRFKQPPSWQILEILEVRRYYAYRFSKITSGADIAIAILKKEIIEDGQHVQRIKIADSAPIEGSSCIVLGWGRLFFLGPSPAELLYVNLTLWPFADCNRPHIKLKEGLICAGDKSDHEKDSCQGDSGGPLICNGVLTGIVSFGKTCGTPNYPGYYTNVWHYRDWVRENGQLHFNDDSELSKHIVAVRRVDKRFSKIGSVHYCAGAIVSEKAILTAAHCLYPGDVPVTHLVVGTNDRLRKNEHTQTLQIENVIRYYPYSLTGYVANVDLAVVRVKKKINEDGRWVQRIGIINENIKPNMSCVVFGWGRLFCRGPRPSKLAFYNVSVWSYEDCDDEDMEHKGLFCAGNRDIISDDEYQGEAGGPIICEGKLAGVANSRLLCRSAKEPATFTNIFLYRDWIAANNVMKCKNTLNWFLVVQAVMLIL